MSAKSDEYKELFLSEALEYYEEVNQLLTALEKNPTDSKIINSIFRIVHTLKGNAAGLGFDDIAEFAHTIEDLFGEVKENKLILGEQTFSLVFRAVDVLGNLIEALKIDKQVRYKGIRTKLQLIINQSKGNEKSNPAPEKTKVATDTVLTESSSKDPVKEEGQAAHTESNIKEKPKEITREKSRESNREEPLQNGIKFSEIIQVPVKKLDEMLNLVGELVIERDRMIATHLDDHTDNSYSRLNRISSDLQYSVMNARLVQVGFLFKKFHRVVRDVAALEHKKVELLLKGTETEIDRNILQAISDSLIHLIRNAVSHGIETTEERHKSGKTEFGTITLEAKNLNDSVVIEVRDDGKGIDLKKVCEKAINRKLITQEVVNKLTDQEVLRFIFEAGFSTAETISTVSGRGVGMDVVKRSIESVGGNISVETTQGKGSVFKLLLPASMAVRGTLLFELSKSVYAIPLSYTEAVISIKKKEIHKVGKGLMTKHLDKTVSVVFLKDLFGASSDDLAKGKSYLHHSFDNIADNANLEIVVVTYHDWTMGLVVDKLQQQKEIVEKPLKKPADTSSFISGVTILGDGNVCLVVNISAIANFIFRSTYLSDRELSG
ncbi:chemotaxis protein CheA [Rapidithrix thailandica]|uniref:Chemotaxis protein CheA n=1 Tax=Rapidithrix thailandica TaxID=413964 RepID=A0AAW9RYY8_9BACT